MEIIDTPIDAVKILRPKRIGDGRGFLSEVYRRDTMERAGLPTGWVQDIHSFSSAPGTVRGMHFQVPPCAQDKLIRVARGRILDVAVDLRHTSPTFGRHVAVELSAENWQQLLIPIGFAHGFCTLEPDTEVIYKVTAFYSAKHDLGVAWNDADLGIAWPLSPEEAVLSDKDRRQPQLVDLPLFFE